MVSHVRPGPLQPYDIRLFSATPSAPGTPSRPHKRPHSPGIGSLDSPAKRRLKAAEGITSPKYTKSPLSGSSSSARFAPAHFHALLQGPDSPAKRLDFGSDASDSTACEGGGSGTPRRSPKRTPSASASTQTTTSMRRSTRLAARRASRSPSASGLRSPSESDHNAGHAQTGSDDERTAAIRVLTIAPLLIPRVVIPPDRQSIHYPGFDIYQDPHILVPVASSSSPDPASTPYYADQEHDKENVAPRRNSSKRLATPVTPSETAWLKAGLLSPTAKGSVKKPVPASPHPKHVHDYLTTPKERALRPVASPAATLVGTTPGRTPLGKEERKLMRRAMEEELDDVDGDDEYLQ
ncbi:hypothetical protein BD311DRAFT_479893 [Dichomitus squalens]|uniref:Uncharacterized protein n=1 Tax=Dichomitus squalens TaxID=114155 RepID=A0A4Q9MYL5_9APHY|nr:hypothetical protein BD311DRAFT_479893 [Dichomitus squalens]